MWQKNKNSLPLANIWLDDVWHVVGPWEGLARISATLAKQNKVLLWARKIKIHSLFVYRMWLLRCLVLFGNTMLPCFLCCRRFFFWTARCMLCTRCSSPPFLCVGSDVILKNGFKQGNPPKRNFKTVPAEFLWTKGTRRVTVVNATYRKSRKSPPRTKVRRWGFPGRQKVEKNKMF